MQTIKDINDLIDLHIRNQTSLADHHLTLLGPRTHGSRSKWALRDLDPKTPLERVSHPNVNPDLQLYRVIVPDEFGAVICAVPLWEAIERGCTVKVRIGLHGQYELFADRHRKFDRTSTNEVYIIVGQHSGLDAVFTWHPGEPLKTTAQGVCNDTAVKLE